MRNVVFVAPFFQETTLRLISGAAKLPNIRLGLISQESEASVPPKLRDRIHAYVRIERGLNPVEIGRAISGLGQRFGSVDRLLGTLEQLQVALGELRDALGIEGMGAEAARNFRDKSRMKTVLQDAGLPCARHRLATTPDEARAFAEGVGFPLVAKPPAGAGAAGTYRLDSHEQLDACLAAMPPSPGQPLLVEEFVTGEEHSFDSVCLGGKLVWYSISHYAPSPLEVLREPWIQWCVLIPREVDRPEYTPIREAAGRALPTLGMRTGLSHLEWFRRPDGTVAISEVGARPPGAQFTKLISYAHDFDLYAAWARLMVFDEFQPRPRPYAAGAAYLRGQGRGQVQTVTGVEEIAKEIGDLVVEFRLPKPGQTPTGTYEGEGYIIVRHPETKVVERALRRIVDAVRVKLG